VLGHDEVGFPGPRRLALVGVLAVQEDNNVRILLDAVVDRNAVGDEVVQARHGRVVDVGDAEPGHRNDLIPQDIVGRQQGELGFVEHLGDQGKPGPARHILRQRTGLGLGNDGVPDPTPDVIGNRLDVGGLGLALKDLQEPVGRRSTPTLRKNVI
jgi:hypothetical protein